MTDPKKSPDHIEALFREFEREIIEMGNKALEEAKNELENREDKA